MKRLFLGVLLIACSAFGQAEKRDEVSVSVQATTQVVTGSVLHLKGMVRIATPGLVILCDEAAYNVISGDIDVKGNVRVARATDPDKFATWVDMGINPSGVSQRHR